MTDPWGSERRPFTGDEYLDSLRDGREIYINGERVHDVVEHPAFRNSARSIARMYDQFDAAPLGSALKVPTDTGNGGVTHPFFRTARSVDDLLAARDAIVEWQRGVYGWMGRSPDYKASFFGTLDANADFYGEYADNARRWYRLTQERLLFFNHAVVHPPIDRARPADRASDVCVHVERETASGLVVSGAKVVATGAALTHANMVGHFGMPLRDKRFGLVFTAPMSTPGLKLICRTSYEAAAARNGTPFDYPLSSRFDENDSILVFDKALIPWENVLMYDATAANSFAAGSGFVERFTFHGCARLAVKLDFIAGCVLKAVRTTGVSGFRGVEAQLGEILNWRDLFWGLSDAMAKSPTAWVNGAVQPNAAFGHAYRTFMATGYSRIKEIIQQVLGSALIYLNSHADDWSNPEIRPYLDRYVRGSDGTEAVDRVKLLKLIWDAIGTEFAGRHELYERNYGGDHEGIRIQTLKMHQASGETDALMAFADQCLSEYDLDGWTRADLRDRSPVATHSG